MRSAIVTVTGEKAGGDSAKPIGNLVGIATIGSCSATEGTVIFSAPVGIRCN